MPIASVSVSISKPEEQKYVKCAEIEIHFIRIPIFTDDQIKDGILKICNGALYSVGLGNILVAKDVSLENIGYGRQKAIVNVYKVAGMTPIPFTLIAGMILGSVISGAIIYFVVVKPLGEAAIEVSRDIQKVIQEKHDALARGLISKEYADKLDEDLESAMKKASEAGSVADWPKFLEKALGMIPLVFGLALLSIALSFLPRGEAR